MINRYNQKGTDKYSCRQRAHSELCRVVIRMRCIRKGIFPNLIMHGKRWHLLIHCVVSLRFHPIVHGNSMNRCRRKSPQRDNRSVNIRLGFTLKENACGCVGAERLWGGLSPKFDEGGGYDRDVAYEEGHAILGQESEWGTHVWGSGLLRRGQQWEPWVHLK